MRFFCDAKTFKNAVLSTFDVQKAPTVQHFVPKSADSAALFSGSGVISWEVMQCENAEILFPYCTDPRTMRPKFLKSDSPSVF